MKKVWYAPNRLEAYGEEEIKAVEQCLRDGWLAGFGPRSIEFEEKIAKEFGKKFGVFVNSGSSACLLALAALDLPKGSKIITPALTFSTTLAPIIQLGYVPIFIDSNLTSYVPNVQAILDVITNDTKAIMIPNLIGNKPDWKALKEGLKSLTPSQRKSLCNCYCTSFTPCTELCKLTECANCTGDAIGDTDMSSMGLPNTTLGYAGIDDQYVLLDNIDDNTAGLNVNANLENLGNKSLVGPHIVQKDTNGISNIFAPYIIMTPKRKNETYGTYLLEDPNDPFQKRFVESVLANY